MLLCCALKTDKLTAGNVNRPLDLDGNFNLSLLSRHEDITSKNLHPVIKVGGTKWYWSHGSQFLEGTRPTGPIGWLRLWYVCEFSVDFAVRIIKI